MNATDRAIWPRAAALLAGVAAALLLLASSARAANRIYWSNLIGNSISYSNLDGSGGGDLPINPATLNGPMGLAIDTAAGKLYWANYGNSPNESGTTIGVANLDGSDARVLPIQGVGVAGPHGVAVDPAANRIYWTNHDSSGNSWIGVANLDGSGGGILNTGAATLNGPRSLALDPNANDQGSGRIYFANWLGNTISFARTDNGGGADLNSSGATVDNPEGVALSAAQGRLYYGNFPGGGEAGTISYINLNGSGGANLNTAGATVDHPHGVAIDPAAGRIYWPNFDAANISSASLDGSGGTDLPTPNATKSGPNLPVLLEAPAATGSPLITAPAKHPAAMRCNQGSWGADLLASLLYRAPQGYSYQWLKNNKAIKGANSASLKRHSVADYRCRVTAGNAAGSGTETSLPYGLFKIGRPKDDPNTGTATLTVKVPGRGKLSLGGKGVAKDRAGRAVPGAALGRKVKRGRVRLLVRPKGKAKRKLNSKGAEKVKIKVVYRPKGGAKSTQIKTVKLRKTR
jgi:DNA-binding beta-propeller fold protein YncE